MFAWTTPDCDTAVSVVRSGGDTVSGSIAAIRRLRVTGTKTNAFKAKPPLQEPDRVDASARNQSPEIDEMIRFLSYSLLEHLSKVISNNLLCILGDERLEVNKFCFQRVCLPLLFATLPESVTKALNIFQPLPP